MRQIKFRAFIKHLKWMTEVTAIDFIFDGGVIEADLSGEGDYSDYSLDEIELMQYTGITDIDGKEIYEGDVVKVEWLKDTDKGVVKQFGCGFSIMEMDWHVPIPLSSMSARIQVIGNIYEGLSA